MKKFISAALIILIILAIPLSILADNASNSIEISFTEGSNVYKVNGKEVEAEKSFNKSGIVFVPLKTIADAFGAQLQNNSQNKSITIKYTDITITITAGSKDAVINNAKTKLPEAPVNINGNIMVPLKFIAEKFGAKVSSDSKTKQIRVTKQVDADSSIKDFSTILKKTSKDKIGDSYYKWTIGMPKGFKVTYRSFSGDSNTFQSIDEKYTLTLNIHKQSGETLDSVLAQKLADIKGCTITNQTKENKNGLEFIKVAYTYKEFTYEDRIYIKNNWIYELEFDTEEEKYYDNKELSTMMDSFSLSFINDNKTEDLSDITSDGYRTYEEKKLKWSIKVPANWFYNKADSKPNEAYFNESENTGSKSFDSMDVYMYSIENGLTLDKWVDSEANNIKDSYNPEIVKLESNENTTINNQLAKKLVVSYKSKDKTDYTYSFYMMGKTYRYKITYTLRNTASDTAEAYKKIDAIVKSFKYSEPSASDAGKLIDPLMAKPYEGKRTVSNVDYKWSCELPVNWALDKDNNNESYEFTYADYDKQMNVYIAAYSDTSQAAISYYFEKEYFIEESKTGHYVNNRIEKLKDKDTKVMKYSSTINEGGTELKQYMYVLDKNRLTYVVSFTIADKTRSEKNMKTIEDIWTSFKF